VLRMQKIFVFVFLVFRWLFVLGLEGKRKRKQSGGNVGLETLFSSYFLVIPFLFRFFHFFLFVFILGKVESKKKEHDFFAVTWKRKIKEVFFCFEKEARVNRQLKVKLALFRRFLRRMTHMLDPNEWRSAKF